MKDREVNTDTLMIAIRKHCLECSGGNRKMVEECEIKNCTLYPFRCIRANNEKSRETTQSQMMLPGVIT